MGPRIPQTKMKLFIPFNIVLELVLIIPSFSSHNIYEYDSTVKSWQKFNRQ